VSRNNAREILMTTFCQVYFWRRCWLVVYIKKSQCNLLLYMLS
jgi:hypothetical protein